jgi:CheY-like chemotaxis protein
VKTLGTRELSSGKKFGACTGSGSGIGLIHAFNVIREAGGKIDIESALNVGTKVKISLPLEEPPIWFIPKIAAQGRLINVVDDDASIHEVWNNRFSSMGQSPSVTHFSCLKAFSESLRHSPHRPLVLIDYEFQGQKKTGLELIRELREKADWVLVTSHFDPGLQAECSRLDIRLLPKGLAVYVPIEV